MSENAMCKCFEEMTEKLKEKAPELIESREVGFTELISLYPKDLMFSFNGKPIPPFVLHFEATWKKTSKKGNVTERKFPIRLTPSHCPLCGQKYKTD